MPQYAHRGLLFRFFIVAPILSESPAPIIPANGGGRVSPTSARKSVPLHEETACAVGNGDVLACGKLGKLGPILACAEPVIVCGIINPFCTPRNEGRRTANGLCMPRVLGTAATGIVFVPGFP